MTNTNKYKKLIEEELALVEKELKHIGRKNTKVPGDWEATGNDLGTTHADENETADVMESYEEHSAELDQLEIRYNELTNALKRIEGGKYGICETGGEQIEEARLDANPAATTCKKHTNDKDPS